MDKFIPGIKFRAVTTGQEFVLDQIVDRMAGKKLSVWVYIFRYTNRPESEHFPCYLKDIERSLYFGSWVIIE